MLLVLPVPLLGASTAMCSPRGGVPDAVALATYSATGVVRAVDAEKKTVLVAHQEIPGYMKAMTMLFELREGALVKGIAPGDRVEFTFTDDGRGRLVVQSLRRLP